MEIDPIQARINNMPKEEKEAVRSYFFRTFPALASVDGDVKALGPEGVLEALEFGFGMGTFKFFNNRIYWWDEEDLKYSDVTELKEEILELLEEEI